MKKIFGIVATIMLFLVASFGYAVGDDLSPKDITMAQSDTVYVDYCVNDVTPAVTTVNVVVDPICEDYDGISGCSGADDTTQTDFTAVSQGDITTAAGAGCTQIKLDTSATAEGLYYYIVNGKQSGTIVVAETGSVLVPEFTTLGAGLVLAGAGLYMFRKRNRK